MKLVFDDITPIKLERELDPITLTLISAMDSVACEVNCQWSFAGGFARDLYLNYLYNDYDIVADSINIVRYKLEEMGVLIKGSYQTSNNGSAPHDYFVDPYSFGVNKFPIHFIEADTRWAFAPKRFDFSINHICLKSDGYFYVPDYALKDFKNKVLRKKADKMTTNIAMRALRFACKYGFKLHPDLVSEIKEFVKKPIPTLRLISNAQKMIEDGVDKESYLLMRKLGFPETDFDDIEDYIKHQSNKVITSEGFVEDDDEDYEN